MWSQNNEEEIIAVELNRLGISTGRFLEIGAWNGQGFSNTYRLAEQGWSGVCVEPSPFVFPKLVENYAGNEKISLINAAVSVNQTPSLVEWFDSGGDAISTTSIAHKVKWENGWKVKFNRFYIYTMPVNAIFGRFGYDFQMVNIDVESTNLEVFGAMPWTLLAKTAIVCVEHDGYADRLASHLSALEFKPVAMNGENLILSRSVA